MSVSESPADAAARILSTSPYHPIRHLTCTFHNGILTICGRLPSFYLKQVAQVAVSGIQGVSHIDNRIDVAV